MSTRYIAILAIVLSVAQYVVIAQPEDENDSIPKAFLKESEGCERVTLENINKKCLIPLYDAPKSVMNKVLTGLCEPQSPCQQATAALKLTACARVFDSDLIEDMPTLLRDVFTMCLKSSNGALCHTQSTTETVDEATLECPAIHEKAECRKKPTCIWTKSCLRRPTKVELDAKCGECKTKIQNVKGEVLSFIASSQRIDMATYDSLGGIDTE